MKSPPARPPANRHDDAYVQDLFDRMGKTYGLMNAVTSFGFSVLWRAQCVANAGVGPNLRVCDLMAGTGECWTHALRRGASVVSLDFSPVMCDLQLKRAAECDLPVEVRCENALRTSLPDSSFDCVIAGFGLKTLSAGAVADFAREVRRLLKPGGRFSLIEISTADDWWLGPIYRWYLRAVIPRIGRLCLADIECYRMLGVYTEDFGSCERFRPVFAQAGLEVTVVPHFFGCATSLVGRRPEQAADCSESGRGKQP